MDVIGVKPFVPSKDFEVSTAFYSEIGFKASQASDDLIIFQNGRCEFFLQRFYNQDLANNFMLQVCVTDINAAFALCSKSVHKTKISDIEQMHWGQVFYLWGPVGELLHITQLRTSNLDSTSIV